MAAPSVANSQSSSLGAIANDYGSSSDDEIIQDNNKRSVSVTAAANAEKPRMKKLKTGKDASVYGAQSRSNCREGDDRDTIRQRLPLPPDITRLFQDADPVRDDIEVDHQGRLRTFPHERGNWATYVYLQFLDCPDISFGDLVEDILLLLEDALPIKDFHISLSRTVVLRHHWIQPFIESLRHRLRHFPRFCMAFDQLATYANEEKSRSFLSLKSSWGDSQQLHRLMTAVDECLKEFNLPTFYLKPSFHMSIGWWLGNKTEMLNQHLPKLQEKLENYCQEELNGNHITFAVDQVTIKSGNKIFHIPLTT